MKLLTALLLIKSLSGNLYSQYQTIDIPELKNVNPADKYPERSILATYTDRFDILISLKAFSAWGEDENIKVLAHYKTGWYKIEINTDHKSYGTFDATCLLMFKIHDSTGNAIWNVLNENHLFDMEDERTKRITVSEKVDTIINNGKAEIVERLFSMSDGPEYEFEILTEKSYKKLYFYEPVNYYNFYQHPIERKWVINCIRVFEKHLGK